MLTFSITPEPDILEIHIHEIHIYRDLFQITRSEDILYFELTKLIKTSTERNNNV